MTGWHVLGALIVLVAFAVIFVMVADTEGWRVTAAIFGFAVSMTAVVAAGVTLLTGVWP